MTTTRSQTCSNCRHWTANKPVIGPAVSQRFGRLDSDCENPRFGELVQCLPMSHSDAPEDYPLLDIYRTSAEFGCRLFEMT